MVRDFCSTTFLSKRYCFFFRALPFGCGSPLGESMSITISLVAGTFDDILCWPFEGTIQIRVFRQELSGLFWLNLQKTDNETTPCFSRPLLLQPYPRCSTLFYLPSNGTFKTHKNLIKNDNVYIHINISDFP